MNSRLEWARIEGMNASTLLPYATVSDVIFVLGTTFYF
jgi:hypothetical protein